ncbi:MAG: GGDEF domain-containing protein [Sulfuricaulis sp.]
MINLFANLLVGMGAGILILALRPVRRLIAQLSPGPLRRHWYVLATMILFFTVGYLGYLAFQWHAHLAFHDLFAPIVFFLGACFVLLVGYLSLETAIDARRMAALEQESITDPLMGIYNRRYLDRRLAHEEHRAQRYGLPLSILMIDIDHFKEVNDTYGHPVGDVILRGLGELITDTVRSTDIVARYGGEEIMVIAPSTPIGTAARLADRLRQAVENASLATHVVEGNKKPLHITISIGVAHLGQNHHDTRGLVQSADEAMYRAKREGRNRVVIDG